jgi:hypothetical protein
MLLTAPRESRLARRTLSLPRITNHAFTNSRSHAQTHANTILIEGTLDTPANKRIWSDLGPKALRLARDVHAARPGDVRALAVYTDAFIFAASSKGIVTQALTGAGNEYKRLAAALIRTPSHDSAVGHALLGCFYLCAPWPVGNKDLAMRNIDEAVRNSVLPSLPPQGSSRAVESQLRHWHHAPTLPPPRRAARACHRRARVPPPRARLPTSRHATHASANRRAPPARDVCTARRAWQRRCGWRQAHGAICTTRASPRTVAANCPRPPRPSAPLSPPGPPGAEPSRGDGGLGMGVEGGGVARARIH